MAFNTESFQLSLQNPLENARFAVEKITDTFLGQDNKIYYKVKWQETWEPEERLMSLCAQLVNEFWKEYYSRTQQQQTEQQQQQQTVHHAPQLSLSAQEHLPPSHVQQQPHDSLHEGHHLNQLLAAPSTSHARNLLPPNSTIAQDASIPHVPLQESHQTQTVQTHMQQLQGVEDFCIQPNPLEKRTTHVFLQPRFLTNGSMLTPRFPFMPNFVQASPQQIMSKMRTTTGEERGDTEEDAEKLKKYSCLICNKGFTAKHNLRKHELLHHHVASSLCCQSCGKKFEKKTALNRHMLSHTTNRPHTCSECGKGFKERSNLTKHLIIHTGARPHACDICNARFRQLGHLLKHLLVHKPDKPHKCSICMKGFKRKEHLKDHLIIHSTDFPYECEVCQKQFRFKTNLKVHVLQHDGRKDFVCEVCQKAFTGKANLVQHRLIHDPDYSFNCDVCSKKFRRKGHLKRHMDIHKNERLLTCVFCKETFPNRPTYRKHLLVHTGSKPFVCTTCDKRFTAKSYLSQHMLTHTEELSFSCDKCDKKFRVESGLAKHSLIHAIGKQFRCEKCNRLFRYNSNLKKHGLSCNGPRETRGKKCIDNTVNNSKNGVELRGDKSDDTVVPGGEINFKKRQGTLQKVEGAVNKLNVESHVDQQIVREMNRQCQNFVLETHNAGKSSINEMSTSNAVNPALGIGSGHCIMHVMPTPTQVENNQNMQSNVSGREDASNVHFENLVLPFVKQSEFSGAEN